MGFVVRKLMDSPNNEPKGIGGWLVLPALGLIITPFRMGFQLFNDVLPALTPETWNGLTKPESPTYHPLWGTLIGFEVIANMALFVFTLWLTWLFFTKSKRVPKLFIAWLLSLAAVQTIDYLLVAQISAAAAPSDKEGIKELARAIINAAIWIPYFIKSKRVKNTFTEPIS